MGKLERFCEVLGVDAADILKKSKTRRSGKVSFAIKAYCVMSPDKTRVVAEYLNLTIPHVNICRKRGIERFEIFQQSEEYKKCKQILEE